MVSVVVFWIIKIGHVQAGRLFLHAVAQIVNQPLRHDIGVHAAKQVHHPVQQEKETEDAQQDISVQLIAQHRLHFGIGDRVDHEFKDIKTQEGQYTLHDDIEDAQPERFLVAQTYHIECLEKLFHTNIIFLTTFLPMASLIRSAKDVRL